MPLGTAQSLTNFADRLSVVIYKRRKRFSSALHGAMQLHMHCL